MTDRPKDEPEQNELVLDWDDEAVESFRLEIESSARAEAAPFPQRTDPELSPPPAPDARERPTVAPPPDAAPNGDVRTQAATLPPGRIATLPPRGDAGQHSLGWRPSLPAPGLVPGVPPAPRSMSSAPRLSGTPPVPTSNLRPGTERATLRPGASEESTPPVRVTGAPPTSSGDASIGELDEELDDLLSEEPVTGLHSAPPGGLARASAPEATRRGSIPEPPPPRTSESAARPSAPEPAPRPSSAEGRPRMYEPPSQREVEALLASAPDREALELEEDDSDATQVAAVPRELIESLLSRSRENENRVTERPAPPPAPPDEPELSAASEQELDDALSDLDWVAAPEDNDNAPAAARVTPPGPRALPPAPPPASPRTSHAPTLPPAAGVRGLDPDRSDQEDTVRTRLRGQESGARSSLRSTSTETSMLRDLEELLPPASTKPPPAAPVELKQPRADLGASVAARTVGARKAQTGYGALSALDDTGKRARIELLRALSQQKNERERAALLTRAGELAEEVRDADTANALYALAHEAYPKLLTPLRALARLAFERRDHEGYLAWLQREAESTESARGRALVLASIARARWLLSRDLRAALQAATEAAHLDPDDVAHKLLLARLELAAQPQLADANLVALACALEDDALAAALLTTAARAREQRGEDASAKQLYRNAGDRAPQSAEAQLGRARLARAEGAVSESAEALLASLPALGMGALSDAVRRHAAVLLATDRARRGDALALLDAAGDGASLRTAFALASATEDRAAQERAALAWATHSDGSERALALVAQAELLAADGRAAAAAPLLAEALRVDRGMSLAKVLWETLARETGDAHSFLEEALPESAERDLRGAAKLAFDPQGAQAETDLLAREEAAEDAACSRALLQDARAELGALAALRTPARRRRRAAPEPCQHARARRLRATPVERGRRREHAAARARAAPGERAGHARLPARGQRARRFRWTP